MVHPSHRLIAYFRDPSRSYPYDPHFRRSKLRQSCSLRVPPLRFPPLQRSKLNESSSHRSGRPVSIPELTSPHSLSQTLRGLILARTRQPYFMLTTFMGFSCSSGCFPLAGPHQIHHLVAPSQCSSVTVRRLFRPHPQGLPPAKVRSHQGSIASSEDPRPSRALTSSSMAFCFYGLEQSLNPRLWDPPSLIHPRCFYPKAFTLTSERHPRRVPLRIRPASHGLPCA